MSSPEGPDTAPDPEDKIADEEAEPDQVAATDEAVEAEGHAEATSEGSGEAEPTDAAVDPDGPADEEGEDAPVEATTPEEPADPRSPASDDELRLGLLEAFKEKLGDAVVGAHIRDGDDLWIRVTSDRWRDAAEVAKTRLGCTSFCFLSAIDWLPSPWGRSETSPFDEVSAPAAPNGKGGAAPPEMVTGYAGGDTRFQMLLRVQQPEKGYGLTIKADLADPEAGIATLIPVYAGANWHEREAWEMYGIHFVDHPHLVHLYLPGEFEGHPLRKDFPLLAREIKPWPGIVDVEPMPDEPDDAEGDAEGEGAGEPAEASA